MKYRYAIAAVLAPVTVSAQVATPERPLTDPRALMSPADPDATPVPVEDLVETPEIYTVAASPDGAHVFLSTNLTGRVNIWRVDSTGGWPQRLTRSDDRQFVTSISPDGNTVYFQQDASGGEYFDIFAVPAKGGPVRNLTGTDSIDERNALPSPDGTFLALSTKLAAQPQTNIAVLSLDSGALRSLTSEDDRNWRWTPVAWSDGGRTIIANRANTDNTQSEIWRIDVATGSNTKLLGEADMFYAASDVSHDGTWISVTTNDEAGVKQAAVWQPGGQLRLLAPGAWDQSAGAFSPDDQSVLVTTNVDGRTSIERVDIESLDRTPVALPPGFVQIATAGGFLGKSEELLVKYQGATSPTELFVVGNSGEQPRQLTRLAPASLRSEHLPRSELVTYRSFDGTLVSAVVTIPFNLKRDGSNPAIIYPHGGPHRQSMDWWDPTPALLASNGYFVIQPNFRGSIGYGLAFQKSNYRDLGQGDLKDVMGARQYLVESGYVDPRRVGITGGSYGGFLTLMAIAKEPDAFAAAVQKYGIIDWVTLYRDQDPRLQALLESMMGTPDEVPEVYRAASPLTYIDAATAPLLTMQGDRDIRVPLSQAKQVNEQMKAKGKLSEIIVIPEEGHGFYKRESQIRSFQATLDWFDRYLKGQN